MSIAIDKLKCIGCGKCRNVCPGSLILKDTDGKAYIPKPQNCWGCTSCIKECPVYAIGFYLGADIGGKGSLVHTELEGDILHWIIDHPDQTRTQIDINKKNSNQY